MKKVMLLGALLSSTVFGATVNELSPRQAGVTDDFWDTTGRTDLVVSQDIVEADAFDGRVVTTASCPLESFDSCWMTQFVSCPLPVWLCPPALVLILK